MNKESVNEAQFVSNLKKLNLKIPKMVLNYNPGTIASFNKVSKHLKTKFGNGSGLPDVITSFYSDYKRGGEPKAKVIKNLVKYAKKIKGESVNEAFVSNLKTSYELHSCRYQRWC